MTHNARQGIGVALLAALAVALAAPAYAGAQPGAEELWQAYPLVPEAPDAQPGGAPGDGARDDMAMGYLGDEADGARDTRLMLQLGMLFAAIYVAILCVWFSATRGVLSVGAGLDAAGPRPGATLVARRSGRRLDVRDPVAAGSGALALPRGRGAARSPRVPGRRQVPEPALAAAARRLPAHGRRRIRGRRTGRVAGRRRVGAGGARRVLDRAAVRLARGRRAARPRQWIVTGVPTGMRCASSRTSGLRIRMHPCEIRPGTRSGRSVPWIPTKPPAGQSVAVGERALVPKATGP